MNYKRILLVGFLILSSFVAWTTYAASTEEIININPIADSSLSLDYMQEDASFRQELVDVKNKVKRQYRGSELVAMSLKFEDGLSYSYLTNYSYVFNIPSLDNKYLIVNNPRIELEVDQAVAEEDLFDNISTGAIKDEYLKINFIQALEIVERSGGYSFRSDRYGKCSITMLLSQSSGGVLNWQISYFDETDNTEQTWIVNAASGKV